MESRKSANATSYYDIDMKVITEGLYFTQKPKFSIYFSLPVACERIYFCFSFSLNQVEEL